MKTNNDNVQHVSPEEFDAIAEKLQTSSIRLGILRALEKFAKQRSGLDWRNYGERESFLEDRRKILRDGRDARELLARCEHFPVALEKLLEGDGRLMAHEEADGSLSVSYCTGQYFPTEYRSAVCRAVAGLYWERFRDDGATTREEIARKARNLFSAGIVKRWFN